MKTKDVRFFYVVLLTLAGLLGSQDLLYSQTPIITTRFSNPQNNCGAQEYCLDVEFKSNLLYQEIFGMNIRFFYDDSILELIDFRDFQGGYGAVAPDPPVILTSDPAAGPALFNFTGAAEFINGAMQLVNANAPPLLLDTINWTKLFRVCFHVDDLSANLDTFCPSLVWDLQQNPDNGGFLSGDDGIVITVVDPDPNNESLPSVENVNQFNWEYTGSGSPPFGQPVDSTCSNVNCTLPLTLLSFKGKQGSNGNLLEWQTINEFNVDGFDLQRTTDLRTWQNLEYIPAKGWGGDLQYYSFNDDYPEWGLNYYRLLQKDQDGKKEYSEIVSIRSVEVSKDSDFTVFPNPFKEGLLYVFIPQLIGDHPLLTIYDFGGRWVKNITVNQSKMALDINDLAPGAYMIRLSNGSNRTFQKVIKE